MLSENSVNGILSNLKKGEYSPVYWLSGEESYYIDQITEYIENNVLTDTEKGFNQTILFGSETTIHQVIDVARRFPVMSKYQVVIVKESHHLTQLKTLLSYAKAPQTQTILVLSQKKKIDKRGAGVKELLKSPNITLFESQPLKENEIVPWINNYIKQKGKKIESKAAFLLAEHTGINLDILVRELDKLLLIHNKEEPISSEEIEKYIGVSKDFNNWELQRAIAVRDKRKVYRIASYMQSNPKNIPLVLTLSTLYTFFSKVMAYHYATGDKAKSLGLNRWQIKDIQVASSNYNQAKVMDNLSLLRTYHMRSRGYQTAPVSDSQIIKELFTRILT